MATNAQTTSETFGQSLWYDNVQRSALSDGRFAQLLKEGVLGCTSNPSIFHKAITSSTDYDDALKQAVGEGLDATQIYNRLVIGDIQEAADLLRPVYDESNFVDGYVSVEVLPRHCHDTEETVRDGLALHAAIDRPNLMIKVPATSAGLEAVAQLTARGVSVNATLIFSKEQYLGVAKAYLRGLAKAKEAGLDLRRIASVASFFVSRIDARADSLLEAKGNKELQGKVAIANAKAAYTSFSELFGPSSFGALSAEGAQKQRLLWASTGTKNASYPDTLYVDELIGPETVNTIPPATLAAFQDHGTPAATLLKDPDAAVATLKALEEAGISLLSLCNDLLEEGLKSFSDAMDALMDDIESRRKALAK